MKILVNSVAVILLKICSIFITGKQYIIALKQLIFYIAKRLGLVAYIHKTKESSDRKLIQQQKLHFLFAIA